MRLSVARRGVAGSTFDHVAREAGVSRGLLHYYFQTSGCWPKSSAATASCAWCCSITSSPRPPARRTSSTCSAAPTIAAEPTAVRALVTDR